jgi:hypothetical protein
MKRFYGLLLTFLLLMQVAGFYIFFVGRLAQLQEASRESLKLKPIELLQRIELSEEDYQKVRVNHREIKLNGAMYDIGRLERINGRVILYAEHDEAEDNLFAFLEEILTRASGDDASIPVFVNQLTTLVYFHTWEVAVPARLAANIRHTTTFCFLVKTYTALISTPPPRL